jgi:hypothetical protein
MQAVPDLVFKATLKFPALDFLYPTEQELTPVHRVVLNYGGNGNTLRG